MRTDTWIQLSVMMFLQFFIWGAWFVTLGTFLAADLQASGGQTGMAFSTQSWGAIIAPFIVGLIADRYFNAERILAVLHLGGAVLMYLMAGASDFAAFYPLVLAYMVLYMPTLALVNSVAFNQMEDPSRHFGYVRVWGTIGWIVAGLAISYLFGWDARTAIGDGALRNTFLMASAASLLLGLFSFFLPDTPPTVARNHKVKLGDLLGLEALALLRDRNFLVFFVSSVLICVPLAFYYQQTNPFLVEVELSNPTGKMTLGQASEIIFMLLLPLFLKRFGIKATLLLGMACWALRYVLFAYGDAGEKAFMLITGIALHGICYDFLFVSGQIFTDFKAGPNIRSAAQGLITLATYGLGMLIGFWVAGWIVDLHVLADGGHAWAEIWLVPAALAAAIFVLFGLLFRNERIEVASQGPSPSTATEAVASE